MIASKNNMEIEIFELILENKKNLYRNVKRAVVVFQSLSRVLLFVTSWIVACQASLSFTLSLTLLKFISIESVMPSNHPLSSPSPPALSLAQH